MEGRTPIALITGSLGSGKTTLLRRVLEQEMGERRLAVLMNEFGEIAIDSRVIEGEHVRIVELAGGCACCALAGEFEAAVNEIIDLLHPEMIVMEATGVAEADSLVYMVEEDLPRTRLDSVVYIVDAYASLRYPAVGYAARSQLEVADIILLNKADLVPPDALRDVEEQVRAFNATAPVVPTVRCDIDVDLLFGLATGRSATRPMPAPEHGFDAFSYTSDGVLDRERFDRLMADLPPEVFRAKGFVRLDDGGYLFNYVAGRAEREPHHAAATELVFIGRGIDQVRDLVLAGLRGAEA